MRLLGDHLHLAEHKVGQLQVPVCGPGDLEIHRGVLRVMIFGGNLGVGRWKVLCVGLCEVVGTRRWESWEKVFMCVAHVKVKNEIYYRLFRPEFVMSWSKSLSSDGFSVTQWLLPIINS